MEHTIVFLDSATIPSHIPINRPSFSHRWINCSLTAPEDILLHSKDATIIIVNKVVLSRTILEQLPHLKHIAVFATGYNNIDIDACSDLGISVSNTRDYAIHAVPEQTLAVIFALNKHLLSYRESLQNNEWQRSPYFYHYLKPVQNIAGQKLGIIGGGKLGQAMATLAKAVGMEVTFAARKNEQQKPTKINYQDFDTVISESDIISLHCPLTKDTKNIITINEMRAMKSSALLINNSRGGLVNEKDLVRALKDKLIAGAALDVASKEPIEDNNPLLEILHYPNFILTPHVAWMSDEAMTTQAAQVIDNIECFAQNVSKNRVV